MDLMTTCPSNPVCRRCGQTIYKEDSVWSLRVWCEDGRLRHDVIRTSELDVEDVVLHMRADRECRKKLSGYVGRLCEEINASDVPRSFLEQV